MGTVVRVSVYYLDLAVLSCRWREAPLKYGVLLNNGVGAIKRGALAN